MKKYLIKWAMMTALTVAICACTREEMESQTGRVIKFKATSDISYITRTTYSGDVQTGTSLERIDWDPGDLIRILSDKAATSESVNFADYVLGDITNSGKFSYSPATPNNETGHGLLWGEGINSFFSVYPIRDMVYNSGVQSCTATFTLPADQTGTVHTNENVSYYGNMDLAFMTAAIQSSEGADITLSFTPVVTTFYVTIYNRSGKTMLLKKVALTSAEPLSGSYTAELSATQGLSPEHNARNYRVDYMYLNNGSYAGTLPAASSENNTIYATFNNLSLENNESIVVALFAMPRNSIYNRSGYGISDLDGVVGKGGFISQLTLSVTSADGIVSLPLKDANDEWFMFASEHKHNLTNVNVPGVAEYVLDVNPTEVTYDYTGLYANQEFTVISSKSINGSTKAAPWKTQIQVDSEWKDLADVLADNTTYPDYAWLASIPVTSETTPDSATTTTRTFRKNVGAQDVISHEDRLKDGVVYGTDGTTVVIHNSAETAVDLSKYDFVNRKMEEARYTANTYIISGPGYYKIPIVYGNGIENNSTIPDAYTGRAGLGHLNDFICPSYFGTEININQVSTRPWLNSDSSKGARIHWEKYSYWDDSLEPARMVTYDRGWSVSPPVSVVDDLSIVTGSNNERYIVFHVDENNIRPGNWVIASMSNSDGTGNVCWSWQIWITDQNMTPVNVHNGSREYNVLPVNLGWVDLNKGQFYPQREATLRFASTEKEGKVSAHTLIVRQKEEEIVSTYGWGTYYQWGRKDPFADGIAQPKDNDALVYKSVLHPNNILYDKSSYWGDRYYDWTVNNYNNLWDSKNTAYESPSGKMPNHKTVYDPSPRRYCVPPDSTWVGFSANGAYQSANSDGIYFYTSSSHANTIFFPASGFMNFTSASTSQGDDIINGYWTYHPGERVQKRASYALSFKYNNSTQAVSVTTLSYEEHGRAYGYSVRPVYYGATIVPGLVDERLVMADAGWTNNQNVSGINYTKDNVTVTFGKRSTIGSDPTYSTSSECVILDIYSTITVSVPTGNQISEIRIDYGSDDRGDEVGSPDISVDSPSGGTYSNGVWYANTSGSVMNPSTDTVVFHVAGIGLTYDRYIKAINVVYKDSSSL